MANPDVVVRPLEAGDVICAAKVLSVGMATNPLNRAAVGDRDGAKAFEAIFVKLMAQQAAQGSACVALLGTELIGVCGSFAPGSCQAPGPAKLKMLPTMLRGLGFAGTVRMIKWFDTWAVHDPKEPHYHLGPVAVHPDWQRKGVGSALLEWYCRSMDERRMAVYLETDKPGNVDFYTQFGFELIKEVDVIGVKNWLMLRSPQASSTP